MVEMARRIFDEGRNGTTVDGEPSGVYAPLLRSSVRY